MSLHVFGVQLAAPASPLIPTPQRLGPSTTNHSTSLAHLPQSTMVSHLGSVTAPQFAFRSSQVEHLDPLLSPPSPRPMLMPPLAAVPLPPLLSPPEVGGGCSVLSTEGVPQPEARAIVPNTTKTSVPSQ